MMGDRQPKGARARTGRMRRAAAVLLFLLPAGPVGLLGQVRATVYPDGRVFVRRVVIGPIPRGISEIALPFDDALAGSFVALDSGVAIRAVQGPRLGETVPLIRRAVGQRVLFRGPAPGDTARALVLPGDPPRFQLADGSVVQSLPGTVVFPQGLAASSRLTVESDRARDRVTLGYMVTGLVWQAHYVLTLSGSRGRLEGYAVLVSDAFALDSAELAVLAGTVPRFSPPATARTPEERARFIQSQLLPSAAGPAPQPEPVRVYRIPGRHSIRPMETAALPLLPAATTEVEAVLTIENPANTPVRMPGEPVNVPVVATYRLNPARAFETGLPGGTVRIYRRDGAADATLVAEALLDRVDPGRPIELKAGTAGDVLASRSELFIAPHTDTTISLSGSRSVRTVATALEYRLRLRNESDEPRTVEIVERRNDPWSVVSSSVPPERVGEREMRFRLRIAPGREEVFHLRARVGPG